MSLWGIQEGEVLAWNHCTLYMDKPMSIPHTLGPSGGLYILIREGSRRKIIEHTSQMLVVKVLANKAQVYCLVFLSQCYSPQHSEREWKVFSWNMVVLLWKWPAAKPSKVTPQGRIADSLVKMPCWSESIPRHPLKLYITVGINFDWLALLHLKSNLTTGRTSYYLEAYNFSV